MIFFRFSLSVFCSRAYLRVGYFPTFFCPSQLPIFPFLPLPCAGHRQIQCLERDMVKEGWSSFSSP
jgi:hypothetical protein